MYCSSAVELGALKTSHCDVFLTGCSIPVISFHQKNMTPVGVNFFGGDDGNRTRVRKEFAGIFSERSRYFRSPPPYRLTTGYTGRQLLMCDRERSRSLFTFTSDRRPLRGRGTPRRDGLHQAAILTVFLSVIFKVYGFYGGSAPPLAYPGSFSPSKPLHPHILS